MNTNRTTAFFRLNAPLQSAVLIFVLSISIAASEALLYYGHVRYSIWAYSLLLLAFSLTPLILEKEIPVIQAFVLIPIFRLVNLAMPVFFELTLLWFPLIYGPLILVFVFLGRQGLVGNPDYGQNVERSKSESVGISHELPWWLGGNRGGNLRGLLRSVWQYLGATEDASLARLFVHWVAQGLFVVLLLLVATAFVVSTVVLAVYLAELEYGIITPPPLIPSLDLYSIVILSVTMIGFVGFVEEFIFRGILQKVLERRLGLVPGLLIASSLFAFMHSAYGLPMEIVFAGGVGLLFGIIYDVTDSLVLVSVLHGLMNVFLFGIIPLDGGSSTDLLRAITVRELHRVGMGWVVDMLPLLNVWVLVGSF